MTKKFYTILDVSLDATFGEMVGFMEEYPGCTIQFEHLPDSDGDMLEVMFTCPEREQLKDLINDFTYGEFEEHMIKETYNE